MSCCDKILIIITAPAMAVILFALINALHNSYVVCPLEEQRHAEEQSNE